MDKKKIAAYIRKYHMIESGDAVIAAVSGGADSVALLLVLSELSEEMNFVLSAVHVEHGIRGEESLRDMCFTEELCGKLGIPLRVCHVDAPSFAEKNGLGLEEAARELRYSALEDAARELRNDASEEAEDERKELPSAQISEEKAGSSGDIKIALAHHMQDQAETVLFRLARGSGLNGLSGMSPVRKDDHSGEQPQRKSRPACTYIRPLLGTSRREIEDYLAARGQEYCVDSTNLDDSYARNRIRSRVLPELTAVNAQTVSHIAQAAEQAAEISDYLAGEAASKLRLIATVEKDDSAEYGSGSDTSTNRSGQTENEAGYPSAGAKEGSCSGGSVRKISIKIPEFLKLHPALRKEMLRQALTLAAGHEKNITAVHVDSLLQLTEKTSGKELSLPYEIKATREFDRLILRKGHTGGRSDLSKTITENRPEEAKGESRRKTDMLTESVDISAEQFHKMKETGEALRITMSATERIVFQNCGTHISDADVMQEMSGSPFGKEADDGGETICRKFINYENLKSGLTVRHRQSGDFFYLKDGHRKKLKQYLIDEKIPVSERPNLWLLARGSQVVWLIGGRENESLRPKGKSEVAVLVEYHRYGENNHPKVNTA